MKHSPILETLIFSLMINRLSCRNTQARRLIRPIMCICNDLYGPALRPLRGKAEVIKMGEPSKEVLLRRLRKIISCEGVSVDNNALHALIEKTNSDPRSCLHSLQFLSRRKRRITRTDVSEAAVGQKDARLQVFDAIRMVIGRRHSQQSWDDSFKAFQVRCGCLRYCSLYLRLPCDPYFKCLLSFLSLSLSLHGALVVALRFAGFWRWRFHNGRHI